MISRRNIRVKVMQTLYALDTQEGLISPGNAVGQLNRHFDQTRKLLLCLTHFLTEVARYAETDARQKASKHLPSQQDLAVNTKIAGNTLLWQILEHPSYVRARKDDKPHLDSDPELVKKIYVQLAGTDAYRQYIGEPSRNRKDEKEILEYILNTVMLPNEGFTGFVEDRFPNWDDDAEMVQQLLSSFLARPAAFDFQQLISPEKQSFGRELVRTTIEKKELVMDYIRPKLKNWEPERIALLDMLLMRMGVCEFLFFETIPPKVTINEYIDLAKEYSTQQSGQFINGILDNIHKDLVREDKMHKVSFKQP